MNGNLLVKDYTSLTGEERFRLILAASGRNDSTERERVVHSAKRIGLSIPDFACHAFAFSQICEMTYIEMLEHAARFEDALDRLDDQPDANDDNLPMLNLSLADAYVLKAHGDGWKLFCQRLGVPAHLMWEPLAGFERLQRALAQAQNASFDPDEFLKWLNRLKCSAGQPVLTQVPITAQGVADSIERDFEERVAYWGG